MALGGGQAIIGWWKASKWRGIWRLDKVWDAWVGMHHAKIKESQVMD